MNCRKKISLRPLVFAIGAGFAVSMASIPLANAASNPFQADKLTAGYNLAANTDKNVDGKCGAGKCGADKKVDGKCGAGKCGADKKVDKNGDTKKDGDKKDVKGTEGKCGAGKCGS